MATSTTQTTTRRRSKRKVKRKKFPYSKVIIILVGVGVVLANIASYILAFRGFDGNSTVTEGINTGYGVVLLGYLLKSLGEHWSMNKFGIEEE